MDVDSSEYDIQEQSASPDLVGSDDGSVHPTGLSLIQRVFLRLRNVEKLCPTSFACTVRPGYFPGGGVGWGWVRLWHCKKNERGEPTGRFFFSQGGCYVQWTYGFGECSVSRNYDRTSYRQLLEMCSPGRDVTSYFKVPTYYVNHFRIQICKKCVYK